ncbi:MAG TPA: DUF4344 domain-containing metallopeptidase [Xanthobacteraceae bacterium]|nr:DUF4344 domain-containing metallopeptidase [Xanthobacteraceae bacterium]
MSTRTRLRWTLAGLLAFGCVASANAPALAQSPPPPGQVPSQVVIAVDNDDGGYRPSQKYAAVRARLVKGRALERLHDFLSFVRLPRKIWVVAAECNGGDDASPHYSPDNRAITLCYQFFNVAEKAADVVMAAAEKNPQVLPFPVTRDEFLWGLLGAVMLHESGHALFDVLDVPVFGREEDAADQFAILVALQLRPQLAEAAVKSYAYFWRVMRDPDSGGTKDGNPNQAFSDVHGTPSQRLYNTLCIAYGRAPAEFGKFVAAGWLPQQRAKGCAQEYAQLASAFAKTIQPFVDQKRMAAVEGVDWLSPNYGPAQPAAPPNSISKTSPKGAPSAPDPASAAGPRGKGA